jgi:hypothetical protein
VQKLNQGTTRKKAVFFFGRLQSEVEGLFLLSGVEEFGRSKKEKIKDF